MKNSSCGLAVLKNSITASAPGRSCCPCYRCISKITPSETGASSLEKGRISCALFAFEKLEVFLFQARNKPVHGVGYGHRYQHQVHIHLQRTHVGAHSQSWKLPGFLSQARPASRSRAAECLHIVHVRLSEHKGTQTGDANAQSASTSTGVEEISTGGLSAARLQSDPRAGPDEQFEPGLAGEMTSAHLHCSGGP